MPGITGRNGAHSGGLRSPIVIFNNPRQAGKAILSYGTLAIDTCTGSICVHDGVTPGGCYCFQQQVPLCDQIADWPDVGNICPVQPDPEPFDPCLLMSALPDAGDLCPPQPDPEPFDPCALMSALPDAGAVCPVPQDPTPFDPCALIDALPDAGTVC